MTIAIIGAGMAGISCAQLLMQAGIEVHCFDKARGPSGRMASRRHDLGACDHGAQYFTAKDRGFRRQVEAWCALGAVAPWPGRVGHWQDGAIHADREATTRYVGTPRMSACLRAASESLPLSTGCQISSLHQDDAGAWWCTDTNQHQHGPFTQVLCTAPAPQAAALLPRAHPLLDPLSQVEMAP